MFNWKEEIVNFDERRDVIIPGDKNETILFCVNQFVAVAQEAIEKRGAFYVALSGGSTPNAIYKKLAEAPFRELVDWKKVFLFWSDERAVKPTDPESNYHNGMEAGLAKLKIPHEQIFRMEAEGEIEVGALRYDELIRERVPNLKFDLVMLGMGEDGHTASLFPKTHGLHSSNRLVVANYVPQKHVWRMTFTYECIHNAEVIDIYVLGSGKSKIVARVLQGEYESEEYPVQRVGTTNHKALWVLDEEAASDLVV